MGQGILRDFVFIHSIGWGDIAVELVNGHIEVMPCEVRLRDSYKGKLVSWDCDSSGVVIRLKVISHRRDKILLAGKRVRGRIMRALRAGAGAGPGAGAFFLRKRGGRWIGGRAAATFP